MRTEIVLQPVASGRMVGMRSNAVPLRKQVELAISGGKDVAINFQGVEATQSFVDELVGALILKHGPGVLSRVVFQNCSDSVRAIVRFVAADRADQFARSSACPA